MSPAVRDWHANFFGMDAWFSDLYRKSFFLELLIHSFVLDSLIEFVTHKAFPPRNSGVTTRSLQLGKRNKLFFSSNPLAPPSQASTPVHA